MKERVNAMMKRKRSSYETTLTTKESIPDGRDLNFFQLLSFYMDKGSGEIFLRGRGENGKNVGVLVRDYEHFFYVSRQTPFESDHEVAETLSVMEHGLKLVASGRNEDHKRKFKTPDPKYASKNCFPKTVYVSKKTMTEGDTVITGWEVLKNKKTIYGWTPEDHRDQVVLVYVQKPCFSSLLSQYVESDHFRTHYCVSLRLNDDVFFKRKMLRTFEGSILPDLVARTKCGIFMSKWHAVNSKSPTCNSNVPVSLRKIHCDEYYCCNSKDLIFDPKRNENANFVRMGFDIECPGAMKKDGTLRFPTAYWGNSKFVSYAKEVLCLPPPVGEYAYRKKSRPPWKPYSFSPTSINDPRSGRRYSSESQTDDETEEETDEEMMNMMMNMVYDNFFDGRELNDNDEKNDDEDEEQKGTANSEEKIKIHDKWSKATRTWKYEDWKTWIAFALKKAYSKEALEEMVKSANLDSFDDLVPDPINAVDRVRCICTAMKRNGDDVGDDPLKFAKKVAFAYEDENSKEKIKPREEKTYGAEIWKFSEIEIRTFDCESEMINAYLRYRREIGVDIEESWNGKGFDNVYLYDRLLYLREHGSPKDKAYAKDLNFGFIKDDEWESKCFEKFTSTNAGGDRLERTLTQELMIHNDGLQVITNHSFGEKLRHNSLDYVSMLKLIHSRSNVEKVIDKMIEDGTADPKLVEKLYYENAKKNEEEEEERPSLKEMMKSIFEDVPMRKMQYDLNEGLEACIAGGTKFRDMIEYCYVDATLPVLIGGKLSLEIAISKAANVTPSDVFEKGVQMKVLSLLYSICKVDFKGLYLIPDKGGLWLHWPGVFDDRSLGFEKATMQDPRLSESLLSSRLKSKDPDPIEEMASYEDEDLIVDETTKTIPSSSSSSSSSSRGKKTLPKNASRRFKKKQTKKPRKAPKKKKEKKKGYTGAEVIPPLIRGITDRPIATLDFSSLYPSECESHGLCYTTFLSSKTIKKYKLEKWQYTRYTLGMASEISCGEYVYDAKEARKGDYHSNELKVAYFYNENPEKTVYGVFIKKLKAMRKVAKGIMEGAEKSLEDIKVHVDDGVPLSKGSEQERMVEKGTPLPLVKRFFETKRDIYDNDQLALKICNNSGYGFPAVNPDKAILPMMEMGATITALGRAELNKAKDIAQRVDGDYARRYAEARDELIKSESDVNPNNERERVHKITREPYVLWKVDPKYVTEKGKGGRKPLVDCSSLSKISDEWIYVNRYDLLSDAKIEVVYGDTDSIMMDWVKTLFDVLTLEGIQRCAESSRYVGTVVNRFQYGGMSIVFEKLSIGTLLKEKKNYMMRLVSELNGKTKEFFERGGSIKRDCLPFVKRIIDEHKETILEGIGNGESMEKIKDAVKDSIKKAMENLYCGNYAFEDFVLSKKITKIAYKNVPEHFVVASKNKKRDNPMSVGSTVYYCPEFKEFTEAEFGSFEHYAMIKRKREEERKKEKNAEGSKNSMQNWAVSTGKRSSTLSIPSKKPTGKKRKRNGEGDDDDYEEEIQKEIARKRPRLTGCPSFKRKLRGIDVMEDANFMKENDVPLDVMYMYKHRIAEPLLAHFAPIFFPRPDMPHVDTHKMTPEKVAETVKIQKKMQKEQQNETRELLFGEFERKMNDKLVAICENAYKQYFKEKVGFDKATDNYVEHQMNSKLLKTKTRPIKKKDAIPKNGGLMMYFQKNEKTTTQVQIMQEEKEEEKEEKEEEKKERTAVVNRKRKRNETDARIATVRNFKLKTRNCECINCHSIHKVDVSNNAIAFDDDFKPRRKHVAIKYDEEKNDRDESNFSSNEDFPKTKLPWIVCKTCEDKGDEIMEEVKTTIEKDSIEKRKLLQKCKACTYFLDNLTLDVEKCKSSHCPVYKSKQAVEAELSFKNKQLDLLNKVLPRS